MEGPERVLGACSGAKEAHREVPIEPINFFLGSAGRSESSKRASGGVPKVQNGHTGLPGGMRRARRRGGRLRLQETEEPITT